MTLTESLAMNPIQRERLLTSATPRPAIFNVGQIGEDQLADMAQATWHGCRGAAPLSGAGIWAEPASEIALRK